MASKQFINSFRMNKMDIQCPFEYLASVQIPFGFGLPKVTSKTLRPRNMHADALETSVEINK